MAGSLVHQSGIPQSWSARSWHILHPDQCADCQLLRGHQYTYSLEDLLQSLRVLNSTILPSRRAPGLPHGPDIDIGSGAMKMLMKCHTGGTTQPQGKADACVHIDCIHCRCFTVMGLLSTCSGFVRPGPGCCIWSLYTPACDDKDSCLQTSQDRIVSGQYSSGCWSNIRAPKSKRVQDAGWASACRKCTLLH